MAKTIIQFSGALILGLSCASCGTFAGIGRDLQVIGKKMEESENRRIFKAKSKSGYTPGPAQQQGMPNYNPLTAPIPEPDAPYPEYPDQ